MFVRCITIAFLTTLLLASCGANPAAQLPTAAPATATVADTRTLTLVATALAPTSPPVGEPTQSSQPTATASRQLTTPAVTQTSAPTTEPSVAPSVSPPSTATAIYPTDQPTAVVSPNAVAGSELLFLRQNTLIAFNLENQTQRQLVDNVLDFATTLDGSLIALVRTTGHQIDLWSVRRDGSALSQLTNDERVEATPAWSPNGDAIVFASANTDQPFIHEWQAWSAWCLTSQIHLLSITEQRIDVFDTGCDPVMSPDGKRIAYAAPPTQIEPGLGDGKTTVNSIRLINRQGQHGWDFAKAQGGTTTDLNPGLLVYAPAWSPDGTQIVYQRFLGYQALVDLDLTEISGSFEGKGKPLADGAGWLLPARFRFDGQAVAISDHNASDARGFGGYDNWSVTVVNLSGTRTLMLPNGNVEAVGQQVDRLARGQNAVWSPDGSVLAVQLPPGWTDQLSPNEPINADGQPGAIWRWQPGHAPDAILVDHVDFASPIAWLP